MARVKSGPTRRRRHKKVLRQTKGFRMTYKRLYKRAHEAVLHAGEYAFAGRKHRKGQMRTLWIQRINGGLKNIEGAPSYSRFIKAMSEKKIEVNRKMMAYLASERPTAFENFVKFVQK